MGILVTASVNPLSFPVCTIQKQINIPSIIEISEDTKAILRL